MEELRTTVRELQAQSAGKDAELRRLRELAEATQELAAGDAQTAKIIDLSKKARACASNATCVPMGCCSWPSTRQPCAQPHARNPPRPALRTMQNRQLVLSLEKEKQRTAELLAAMQAAPSSAQPAGPAQQSDPNVSACAHGCVGARPQALAHSAAPTATRLPACMRTQGVEERAKALVERAVAAAEAANKDALTWKERHNQQTNKIAQLEQKVRPWLAWPTQLHGANCIKWQGQAACVGWGTPPSPSTARVQPQAFALEIENKKVVRALVREVGEEVPLSKILDEASDWKGRREQLIALRDQVKALKAAQVRGGGGAAAHVYKRGRMGGCARAASGAAWLDSTAGGGSHTGPHPATTRPPGPGLGRPAGGGRQEGHQQDQRSAQRRDGQAGRGVRGCARGAGGAQAQVRGSRVQVRTPVRWCCMVLGAPALAASGAWGAHAAACHATPAAAHTASLRGANAHVRAGARC